ncbi:MAG TPA: hypothetical protein VLH77_00410, partial [Gammaproteobacteria bacterium]|nr:hypothetical protein [Gammaproteobacteria bacterium]
MLFKNLFTKTLLWGSFCFLSAGCSSLQQSGPDDNSAEGFQKEPINQASSQERLGKDYLLGRGV